MSHELCTWMGSFQQLLMNESQTQHMMNETATYEWVTNSAYEWDLVNSYTWTSHKSSVWWMRQLHMHELRIRVRQLNIDSSQTSHMNETLVTAKYEWVTNFQKFTIPQTPCPIPYTLHLIYECDRIDSFIWMSHELPKIQILYPKPYTLYLALYT